MLEQEIREEEAKTDEINDIRRQYEQAELEESLKKVLFGGYSKKKVNEVISTYKEMVGWMQESFDYRLGELNKEKERICNERVVLKKQLSEELEKNKKMSILEEEARRWEQQYQELRERYEASDLELQLSREEKDKLYREYKAAKKRLQELEQELQELKEELVRQSELAHQKEIEYQKELACQKELVQQELKEWEGAAGAGRDEAIAPGDGSLVVAALTLQLEELTAYCESMETQQRSLELQISSMKNISQELEKLSSQYEENQIELKDARRKYLNAKNENRALNSEMESTGRILEDILAQFEQKESENDILRREVSEFQEQLMAVKREKLAQERASLNYMERAYNAEKECKEAREETARLKKELEELQRKCISLENSKVIKIQSTVEPAGEDYAKKGYISEKERIDEVLRRALAVTERAAAQEEEKKDKGQAMDAADGKEVL